MANNVNRVRVEDSTEGLIRVTSPYNPEFVAAARKLNGKWSAPYWVFDKRDEDRVRKILVNVYGCDGTPITTVNCRVYLPDAVNRESLFMLGRELLHRNTRDTSVRLGVGVVVLQGGFFASGGSVKYPVIGGTSNMVLEVRDVPETLANREVGETNGGPPHGYRVVILDKKVAHKDDLENEKAKLLARLAEVNAALSAGGPASIGEG